MTTAADDSADEKAFEAFLAGKPVPEQGATLAAFAGAVRMAATEPGRPNAALAELLATGLLIDQPPLSVRTAKRRRRRMWFFSVVFAKIASAGAIAQAATGAGIVLVGFTGIGAAGALPTPVQHTFATVVASITPLTAPDGATTTGSTTDPAATTTAATTTVATETSQAAEPTGAADGAVVGGAATATTTAPKNHGQEVSSQMHERNAARKSAHKDDSDGEDTSTAAPTSAGSDGESADDAGEHTSGSPESGHGSGNGNGENSGHSGN